MIGEVEPLVDADEPEINEGDLVILEKVDHFRWKFVLDKAMEVSA